MRPQKKSLPYAISTSEKIHTKKGIFRGAELTLVREAIKKILLREVITKRPVGLEMRGP